MANIVVSADELDMETVSIINKRKEDTVCLIDKPYNFHLLRGINKRILSLTEDTPSHLFRQFRG